MKKIFKKKIISKFNGKCFNFDFESTKNQSVITLCLILQQICEVVMFWPTERDSENGSKSKAVSIFRKKASDRVFGFYNSNYSFKFFLLLIEIDLFL